MGEVWEAWQFSLNRVVALKMIKGGRFAGGDEVRRFLTEAEKMAHLRHANIVPIHVLSEHEGVHYFTMDLMEGGSLAEHVARFRGEPRRAAELVETIAHAVHFACQHGILHRDLKPANILLDKDDKPYVADFGIAIHIDRVGITETGASSGTPQYMSPEQAKGETRNLTTATDVYGLGAILYHLLTARPPFEGEGSTTILKQVIENSPVDPRNVDPKIDRYLSTICLRCLKKDPALRYGSADELARELRRYLNDEPPSDAGLAERARSWCRRHPSRAAFSALLFVVALCAGVAAFSLLRARQEAFRAQQAALHTADFAAHRAADVTALQFDRYKAAVEAAGRDPRVVAAVADPASSRASEICALLRDERLGPFDHWSLYNVNGTMIGRAPVAPNIGRSYTFRDYFRGVAELEQQGRREAYVSRAFRSESDGNHQISITFAVHDDADRWVGLIGAALPTGSVLGSIALDETLDDGLTAALLAPRGRERSPATPDPEPMFILHPALGFGEGRAAAADLGSGFMRLVPVRGTPFSVLVRVAYDGPLTGAAPPLRR